MRLLIDARTLGQRPSGIGMYLYNFICGLQKYSPVTIELVTDVAESAQMRELIKSGLSIHRYGRAIEKSVGVYAYFRFVQKVINQVRPDIFWEGNNLLPLAVKNPYGKVVVTVHDVFPLTEPDCYGRIYPPYFKWNLHKTLRHVDAVLYNSRSTGKEVEREVSEARRIPSYVSYNITEEVPDLTITDEGYYFYVGNLEKRKGTDLLIRAYLRYRESGGTRKLYLAGKIREKEIEEQIEGAKEQIRYLGYLTREEKYKCYAACSAFVFPSRAEGFGMPVIEALACQKDVLVTDRPIFHEIAGDAVFYCALGGTEEETERNLAREMRKMERVTHKREKSENIVKRYRSERLTEGLLEFFQELLGNEYGT
jgi:glycosyltransferase involved in cell wall biosynthesis